MDDPPEWEGERVGPFVTMRSDRTYLMDFGETPSDAQLDEHVDAFTAWCDANREPVAGVVYLRKLLVGTAKQRKRMAELEKRLEEHDRQYMHACGIVAPNAMTRGLVTAVFWLKPPIYPYKLFSTFDGALSWVVDTMQPRPGSAAPRP